MFIFYLCLYSCNVMVKGADCCVWFSRLFDPIIFEFANRINLENTSLLNCRTESLTLFVAVITGTTTQVIVPFLRPCLKLLSVWISNKDSSCIADHPDVFG